MNKVCKKCKISKRSSSFYKHRSGKNGISSICKSCHIFDIKKNQKLRPIDQYPALLKCKYGITIERYNSMFENQNGCCAICNKHQSEFKKRLNVDHNHSTGKIRALLCSKCNTAIGSLEDNTILLKKAIDYLITHN